jgi:hypothetical protein
MMENKRHSFTFNEHSEDVILTVRTLCPEKWLLIDRETGEVYQGSNKGFWDKLVVKQRKQDDEPKLF